MFPIKVLSSRTLFYQILNATFTLNLINDCKQSSENNSEADDLNSENDLELPKVEIL